MIFKIDGKYRYFSLKLNNNKLDLKISRTKNKL